MNRTLIALASVGILAPTVWVVAANAQYGSPPPGQPQAYMPGTQGPWEWYAGPGPKKRGTMCTKDVDVNRGYGFLEPCPPPKKAAKK
jgi:hypothetical protein